MSYTVFISTTTGSTYTHKFPAAGFVVNPDKSVEVWRDKGLIGFFPAAIAAWVEAEGDDE